MVSTTTTATVISTKMVLNKERKGPKDFRLNLNDIATTTATADDDIDNAKLHPKWENLIRDLDGIQQYLAAEYNNLDKYVNNYNSTTDKTKLMILDTHQVNNSIHNEADVGNDSIPDDNDIRNEADVGNDSAPDDNENNGVIYDRTIDANPLSLPPESSMLCIHSKWRTSF